MDSDINVDTFLEAILNRPEDGGAHTLLTPIIAPLSPAPALVGPEQVQSGADSSGTKAPRDFDALLETLDWNDISTTLSATVEELLGLLSEAQSPPPASEAPPRDPVPQDDRSTQPQPGTAPRPQAAAQEAHEAVPEPTSALPDYYEPVSAERCPWPVGCPCAPCVPLLQQPAPGAMAGPCCPVAHHIMNSKPLVPSSMLRPVGVVNGEMMYTYEPEPCSAYGCASVTPSCATFRNLQCEYGFEKPYIKKPPNAFMLYRAEQSLKVKRELSITDTSKINTVIGQRWKMLSEEEQAVYFEQAHAVRRAHEARYPGWSTKDNFGKRMNRRRKTNTTGPVCSGCHAVPMAPVYDGSMGMWPAAAGQINHFSYVPLYFPVPSCCGPVTWPPPGY